MDWTSEVLPLGTQGPPGSGCGPGSWPTLHRLDVFCSSSWFALSLLQRVLLQGQAGLLQGQADVMAVAARRRPPGRLASWVSRCDGLVVVVVV